MKILGNAIAGTTYPDHTPDLPRATITHGHRPWCVDCKRKHDPDQLDDDQRCEACARAAVVRAAAAERRAADPEAQRVWDEALKAHRAPGRRQTTKLPKAGKQGQPTTRRSAPRATSASSTTGRAPVARPATTEEKNPPAARETRPAAAGGAPDLPGDFAQLISLLAVTRQQLDDIEQALWRLRALLPTPQAPPAANGFQTFHKPRRQKLDEQQVSTICDRYQAGDSTVMLAEAYAVSTPTITNALRRSGVALRTPAEARRLALTRKEPA